MLRVAHVITTLHPSVEALALERLLPWLDPAGFACEVCSLLPGGRCGEGLAARGVPVHSLGLRPGRLEARGVWRLTRWLREGRFDVVQTWSHRAALTGSLAARLAGGPPVVWGLHRAGGPPGEVEPRSGSRAWWGQWVLARLSSTVPERIVCGSHLACRWHAAQGFDPVRMQVIPHGFELPREPRPEDRSAVRRELELAPEAPVVGVFTRSCSPQDCFRFIGAAAVLARRRPDARFVLCGALATWQNGELAGWLDRSGLREQFRLTGSRPDALRLLAGFDVLCSPATSEEALPWGLGEAMALGVPCVAVDVGDVPRLLGPAGPAVPPGQSRLLGEALDEVLSLPPDRRAELSREARRRVAAEYSIVLTARRYQEVWRGAAMECGGLPPLFSARLAALRSPDAGKPANGKAVASHRTP